MNKIVPKHEEFIMYFIEKAKLIYSIDFQRVIILMMRNRVIRLIN